MIKLPKKTAQAAQPEALTVRAALAETGCKSDAELMREAAERVLGTDPVKAAAQAAEDAARHVLHIPVPAYPPGMFDAPHHLESLRREVVKLQALVEAKSTPPAEQVQPAEAAPRRKQRQRDLMAGVIEAAQRECNDPQDTTAVWLILERKAAAGERPLKGKTEDGLKWVDEKDDVRFLTRKMLRDRITPRSKKTRKPPLRRVK